MFLKKGVLHLIVIFTAVFAVTHIIGLSTPLAVETETVTVFAAASTTNAITEIGKLFEKQSADQFRPSFASSSTLAKQIEQGAPADVFISANIKWMDYLETKKMIEPGTRFDLLSNRIVLIAPLESSVQHIEVEQGLDLSPFLGKGGRLSLGDPGHVPAGIYGKEAMKRLGMWEWVRESLAPMKDVRAALVLVERSEAPLGQVYATDAAISRKVRIVGTFPVESHPPIVYPVAAVAGGKKVMADKFLTFLKTPEARSVFVKYGFEVW